MVEMTESVTKKKKGFWEIRIMGFKISWFLILSVVLYGAIAVGVVPGGIGGGFLFGLILGSMLDYLGDHLPIVKDYLGGGSIMIIFGSAALSTFGVIPTAMKEMVGEFFQGDMDYLNFALSIFITGSIVGTSKVMLKKASIRFIPTVVGAQIMVMVFAGIAALLTGQDIKDSILFVAIPITAGGMSAGAIPLSQIYETNLGVSAEQSLSIMAPSIALANAIAIVFAGVVSNFVKKKPKLTGYGKMMPLKENDLEDEEEAPFVSNYKQFAMGFVICFGILLMAQVVNNFLPQFHSFAYMAVICIVLKLSGALGKEIEDSVVIFYNAIVPVLRVVILVCIGVTLIDLKAIAAIITPGYFLLVLSSVIGAFFGAAIIGKIVGLFPVEAGISAGLCAADMGGTGDLGILGAADRMELLPFSTIATRIGGAIILIIGSIVSSLLG